MFVAIVYAFAGGTGHVATQQRSDTGLDFIDTSFENASPAWYEADRDGTIQIHLLYDHERSSPNRAAGHIHLRLHGTPGAKLTLEFGNLDNVWNGTPASVAQELKTLVVSEDGRNWKPVRDGKSARKSRAAHSGNAGADVLYVARLEPYRLSDLTACWDASETIHGSRSTDHRKNRRWPRPRDHPDRSRLRAVSGIPAGAGASVGSRQQLDCQGLVERLLKDDAEDERNFSNATCVYILPMANKDGVARRDALVLTSRGKDLNRNWDKPARPALRPENSALEKWLEGMIAGGRRLHLALELHNDGNGQLHISRPPVPELNAIPRADGAP